jgi:carbamoyltransferase
MYDTLSSCLSVADLGVIGIDEERLTELFPWKLPGSDEEGTLFRNAPDLARAGQAVYEEILFALLRRLHAIAPSGNLVFTGECALNTLANGKVLTSTPFKTLHVPCAPSRTGNAVGAALLAHREQNPSVALPWPRFESPFVGAAFAPGDLASLSKIGADCEVDIYRGDASRQAATLLSRGVTVGWIQGRSELGGRGLGNRSILLDPRRSDALDVMTVICKRDGIRPFGLSILHEYGAACCDRYQVAPYMDRALRLRPKLALRVPAVVRDGGLVEIQTVKRDWNEKFYDMLLSFYIVTAIPFVVNMSYFATGSTTRTLEDVIAVFREGAIDALFVDEILLVRRRRAS